MMSTTSVGTTAVEVLPPPANGAYKFVAISNVGSEECFIKVVPDTTALTATNGIPLSSGASFVVDQDAQREMFDAGASAITASGTTSIAVQAF